ncbi:MAG: DUF1624 domain-containing protein [Lachnospiraceae bacterium]|nr:DUF1624 domain-containing protein [Lachnospiraceae bacterium]
MAAILEIAKAGTNPALSEVGGKEESILEDIYSSSPHARYQKLDGIRGLTLISMILYHGMWDLVYLFGVRASWYGEKPGFIWQQTICWTFILLSGFCRQLGRRHFKRGLTVFASGALITLVTALFMPTAVVHFGVLTLLGSCMLLTIPLEGLINRIPPVIGLMGSFLLFLFLRPVNMGYIGWKGIFTIALPAYFYQNYFTAFLGFPPESFFSTDYFSLLPWFFLFLTGSFLYRLFKSREWLGIFVKGWLAPLEFLGRHSLILYMVHQPILYGVLSLIYGA